MSVTAPIVLCLSGHDPGGGAGIHADIEAIAAQNAHALTLITAHTVQDSRNVRRVEAVPVALLREQFELLRADSRIAAIKIGLIGDAAQIPLLVELIRQLQVPAICDPILRAGGGSELSNAALREALLTQLLPVLSLLTPNAAEARRLAPEACDTLGAARALQARGAAQLLVTGGDEPGGDSVENLWLDAQGQALRFHTPRLPQRFHGAGCTLAAAIAGRIAVGDGWFDAISQAQRYTHRALATARATGRGRLVPRRIAADASTPRDARLRGLYAITPEALVRGETDALLAAVGAAIRGGARLIQYRDKWHAVDERLRRARALAAHCHALGAWLLINDDVELALDCDADGVHLGRSDGSLAEARARLGANAIIGATCHNSLDAAREAAQAGASYLAFGRFFSSKTKPDAPPAELATLAQARRAFGLPVCAIGGITPALAPQVIDAGADLVAAIDGVFGAADIEGAARAYGTAFIKRGEAMP